MNTEPSLSFEPSELNFQLELNKQLSSTIRLLNKTDKYVGFKLLSTKPRNYVVRPRIGILPPGSTREITVTTRALSEASHNMRCKDKFMIRSAVATRGATPEDARGMFDREAGNGIHEWKLRVVYSMPTDSSTRTSVIENQDSHVREATDSVTEPHENDVQAADSVMEPHDNDVQATDSVMESQENDVQVNSNHTGELILRGIISGLLVLISLYFMKKTLSWIWSLTMIAIMLMIKMIKKLVSDSVEDWVVKTLVYIFMHILFGRKNNVSLS